MTTRDVPNFEDVLAAAKRIKGHARRTPILSHDALNARAGADLFIKAECLQVTGSFKIRGATNRLAQFSEDQKIGGVVAFSSGNHAQGVARAARRFGMPAVIVMPSDSPRVKVDGVRADGGEIVFYDRFTENREAIADELCRVRNAVLVPSYDDFDIVAGQGTAGLEFVQQMAAMDVQLDHVICCAGGGGLSTGSALAFERLSPETKFWTAEPAGFDDWARSLEAGQILANAPDARSICDAVLTPQPGNIPFALGRRLLAGGLVATDEDAKEAVRAAFRYLKIVAEPGGAIALAVALSRLPDELKGGRIGVFVSGGNVDADQYASILSEA